MCEREECLSQRAFVSGFSNVYQSAVGKFVNSGPVPMSLRSPSDIDVRTFVVMDLGSCPRQLPLFEPEQLGIGVIYWDFEQRVVYRSLNVAELYGLVPLPKAQRYDDYLERVHPEDRFELNQALQQVKLTTDTQQIDYRLVVNHREKWIRSKFTSINVDGRSHLVVEIVSDVSELKFAQRALVENETRWRRVTGYISDVLIETTLSGEIVFAADSITPLWGYLPDELRGANLLSIVDLEDSFFIRSVVSGHHSFLPISFTANFLHKDHSWRVTQCNIHSDVSRNTLFFVFKPYRPTELTLDQLSTPAIEVVPSAHEALHRYSSTGFYTTICDILACLLHADCIHVYRYDAPKLLWRNIYDYHRQPDLKCALGLEISDHDEGVSHLFRQTQPSRVEQREPLHSDGEPEFISQLLGSWMVLPIQVNAKLWGAILIVRFDEDDQWTDYEFDQAMTFGNYINLAIALRYP